MSALARFFIILGILFVVIGVAVFFVPGLGHFRVPGDIIVRRNNVTVYIPIATSIILSLLLTIMLNILVRR